MHSALSAACLGDPCERSSDIQSCARLIKEKLYDLQVVGWLSKLQLKSQKCLDFRQTFYLKTWIDCFNITPKKKGPRQSLPCPYVPGDLVTKQLISREQFDRARMLNDLLDRKRLAAFAALHRVFRQTNYDERTTRAGWNPKLINIDWMVGRCSVSTSFVISRYILLHLVSLF